MYEREEAETSNTLPLLLVVLTHSYIRSAHSLSTSTGSRRSYFIFQVVSVQRTSSSCSAILLHLSIHSASFGGCCVHS